MKHRRCGGELVEREDLEPYTVEGNFCAYPIVCKKCGMEVLGDEEVEIEGWDNEFE